MRIPQLILALFLLTAPSYADDFPKNKEKIMDEIFYSLDAVGTLKQDANGMVYVDVDNDFIYKLYPWIQEEGFELPTSLYGNNALGAHVTVIYKREAEDYQLGWIKEAGDQVYFKVTGCKIIPLNQAGYELGCVVTIQAPNLDKLRKKYGLPSIKYDYHILIGMKPRKVA
ncbi:MAG: hypothetical protein K1X28_09145 [Parachlamydiales bacterium]|nr:hypothetical protein [Parachlamydiales bacterium]